MFHSDTSIAPLSQDCSDLHVSAMEVLSVCLEDTEQMVALQSSGCLRELMTHTSSSTLPEMKRNAVSGRGPEGTDWEHV